MNIVKGKFHKRSVKDVLVSAMNSIKGTFHKLNLEELLINVFQVAIVALVLFIVAMVAADAWIKEDTARVERLAQHIYEVALNRERATVAPAAPTGVKPNYGDLSTPKTRVFQDASQRSGK